MKAFLVAASSLLIGCAPVPPGAQAVKPPIVDVPFAAEHNQVEVRGTLAGRPAIFLIDTGLNPSGFGVASLRSAGIPIDEATRFQLGGVGSDTVFGYDVRVDDLTIGGVQFGGIEAVADTGPIFTHSRRQLDGILGISFLRGKLVMIDYPQARFRILSDPGDAAPFVRSCSQDHTLAFRPLGDDTIPVIHDFDFGSFRGPVSIDTGSSLRLTLYGHTARRLHDRLQDIGSLQVTGARGAATRKKVRVRGEMGFGPFRLRGFEATVGNQPAPEDLRLANLGNRFLSDVGAKLLLDYRRNTISVFGDCSNAQGP